jgi:hypothetical protein
MPKCYSPPLKKHSSEISDSVEYISGYRSIGSSNEPEILFLCCLLSIEFQQHEGSIYKKLSRKNGFKTVPPDNS